MSLLAHFSTKIPTANLHLDQPSWWLSGSHPGYYSILKLSYLPRFIGIQYAGGIGIHPFLMASSLMRTTHDAFFWWTYQTSWLFLWTNSWPGLGQSLLHVLVLQYTHVLSCRLALLDRYLLKKTCVSIDSSIASLGLSVLSRCNSFWWVNRIRGTVAYMWPLKWWVSLQACDLARKHKLVGVGHHFGKVTFLATMTSDFLPKKL